MIENADISWVVVQRYEFIEWRSYWAGRLNRKDLEDQFQISTPQASIDLRNYQEAAPGNIEYNSTEKTYLPTANFRPKFLRLSAERYLLQLHAMKTEAIRKSDTWFGVLPPAEVPERIIRAVEWPILRSLLRAIEERLAIGIYYQSLTKLEMRSICPHSLAYDGHRWHVRAMSAEKGEFRDYTLTRMLSLGPFSQCRFDPADDLEWNTMFTLRLKAHPDLNPDQKAAVERDYRFVDGELKVTMRLALAYYFVTRNNLDLRHGEIPPNRVQLYLINFDEYEAERVAAKQQAVELATKRRLQGEAS